jgi:hypothetical protein
VRFRAVAGAGLVALFVWMGRSVEARADDPAAAVPSEALAEVLPQARRLFTEGVEARKAQRWERAYELFLGAWHIHHHWQIAANLANTELVLGRYRDAVEHAGMFLRQTRDLEEVDMNQRASVARVFASARARVGAVVVTAPDGAEILVDGSSVGRAPLDVPIYVEPGRRRIGARLDGYSPSSEERDLAPSGEAKVDLRLVPIASSHDSPPPPPMRPPPPPPNQHASNSVNEGIVLGGVMAGVAVAGLGIGIGLQAWSSHLQTSGGCMSKGPANEDPCRVNWARAKNASIVSFVGAGLLGAAAAGTLSYALTTGRSKAPPLKASVQVGPGDAAASLSMAW